MSVPSQIPRCACAPDDYRACNGEFYACECCGQHFDGPLPYAEAMESAGLDLKRASSWFFYCQPCAFEWVLDGANIRVAA